MKTTSLLFCLMFALYVNAQTANAQVNVQDSLALVDLYNSTNGPNWDNNSGWLTGPVSKWYGITVTDTRVTKISLVHNKLNGKIASSISNLANLRSLDLSFNQLSSSIPASIGKLVNLRYLDLINNQLSGNIPNTIGNLAHLTHLYLSRNQLSGSIPASIGKLTNLY